MAHSTNGGWGTPLRTNAAAPRIWHLGGVYPPHHSSSCWGGIPPPTILPVHPWSWSWSLVPGVLSWSPDPGPWSLVLVPGGPSRASGPDGTVPTSQYWQNAIKVVPFHRRGLTRIPGLPGFSRKTLIFLNFWGVLEVREGFREVPGGGTLHSGRIWASTEQSRPNSSQFL